MYPACLTSPERRKRGADGKLARDRDNWRTWIATKGPILTRLDVDRTWDDAKANKGNMDVYRPDTTRGFVNAKNWRARDSGRATDVKACRPCGA